MASKKHSLTSSPSRKHSVIAEVLVAMGSDSDLAVMQGAVDALKEMGLTYHIRILSAHRTPVEMADFAQNARRSGYRVIIAGAGGAAHLPGMIAAHSVLPVIGVPVPVGTLGGQDALYSIVQMPKGVPVATVAIGGAFNAGILAAQIMATGGSAPNEKLLARLEKYKGQLRDAVLAKTINQ